MSSVRYNWGRKFGIDIPAFGGLPDNWIDILAELLSPDLLRKISALAKSDSHVAEIMEWVESRPDLSDDEIDHQVFEQQKSLVQDMGLSRWLEMIDKWRDVSDDKTGWEKLRSRVIAWAQNNRL